MAESIDRLTTVFDARFDRLEEKLNKAVRATYGAASKIEKRWDSANDNIANKFGKGLGAQFNREVQGLAGNAGRASTVLSGLGVAGTAAAAGLGALVVVLGQARAAIAFGDAIADASAKIGVSTDTLQEYRYAIHQVGGETADADEALSKFTITLGKAQVGLGKRSIKGFNALGLDPKQFKDTDEALKAVLQRLSQVQSESQRQGIASALGLEKFIPLAREGADKLDGLREAAHRLGYVMDKELVARAGEANDKLEDLEQITSVQLKSAFVDLAPVILSVAGAIASAAREVNKIAGDIHDALPVLKNWFELLKNASDFAGNFSPLGIEGKVLGQGAQAALQKAAEAGRLKSLRSGIADIAAGKKVTEKPSDFNEVFGPKSKPFTPIDQSGGGGKGRKASTPRDTNAERIEQTNATLATANRDLLQAQLGLTDNIEDRAKIERQISDAELAATTARLNKQKADLDDDKGISDATRKRLKSEIDYAEGLAILANIVGDEVAKREAAFKLEDKQIEVHTAIINAQLDELQAQADIATTAAERNRLEKKILDLRQQLASDLEGTQIDRRVAKGEITPGQAQKLKDAQATTQGAEQTKLANDQRGPFQRYVDSIKDVDTAFQELEVNGIQSLTDGIAGAIAGTQKLGDVFRQTIQQMAVDANRILLQSLISGAAGDGGGSFLKSLFKIGASAAGSAGGGSFIGADGGFIPYANGTDYHPGGWAKVGEHGPEFLNLPRGSQVIPNDILRNLSSGRSNTTNRSMSWSGNVVINAAPGMTRAEARKSGSQAAAELRRQIAMGAKQGY